MIREWMTSRFFEGGSVLRIFGKTILAIALLSGCVTVTEAQTPATAPVLRVQSDTQDRAQSKDTRPMDGTDDERKAELLAFAKEHQPGVARLLNLLEQRNPPQYQRAIESLDRDVRRLENTKRRDSEGYELALKRWKNSSAIELLTANIALFGDKADEQAKQVQMRRLRQLVAIREELRAQQLKMEIAKLRGRVEKAEEQLASSEANRKQIIEKSMTDLINRAKRMRNNNGKAKPSDEKSKNDGDGGSGGEQ